MSLGGIPTSALISSVDAYAPMKEIDPHVKKLNVAENNTNLRSHIAENNSNIYGN